MQFCLFIANAMYMGGQEMKKVLQRDNITIKNNLEKVRRDILTVYDLICSIPTVPVDI